MMFIRFLAASVLGLALAACDTGPEAGKEAAVPGVIAGTNYDRA